MDSVGGNRPDCSLQMLAGVCSGDCTFTICRLVHDPEEACAQGFGGPQAWQFCPVRARLTVNRNCPPQPDAGTGSTFASGAMTQYWLTKPPPREFGCPPRLGAHGSFVVSQSFGLSAVTIGQKVGPHRIFQAVCRFNCSCKAAGATAHGKLYAGAIHNIGYLKPKFLPNSAARKIFFQLRQAADSPKLGAAKTGTGASRSMAGAPTR